MENSDIPCAMTVAGSDSGAGAGIQADILTFAANGVYACSAIAALTAQNPNGVYAISAPDAAFLRAQMDAVADFYKPNAAKTGMLFDAQSIAAAADFFASHPEISLVVDPVAIATSGAKLLKDDAVEILKSGLIPISALFTPNLDEGAMLLGVDEIGSVEDAAQRLFEKYSAPVLLKGGHMRGDDIRDVLCDADGLHVMPSRRIPDVNTHGSGCTLSAAIAANLAKGKTLEAACADAKKYLSDAMARGVKVGGETFINHFPNFRK